MNTDVNIYGVNTYEGHYEIHGDSGQVYNFRDQDDNQTIDEKEGPYRKNRYLKPGTKDYQTALKDLRLEARGNFVGIRLYDSDPRRYDFDPVFHSNYQTITLYEYLYLLRAAREIEIPTRHYQYPFTWTDEYDWRSRVWTDLILNRFEENGFDARDFDPVLLAANVYQKLIDCHTKTVQGILNDILTADFGPINTSTDFEGVEERRRLVVELWQAESRAKGESPQEASVLIDEFDQKIGYEKLLRAYASLYERVYDAYLGVYFGGWWEALGPEGLQTRLTQIQERIDHYHQVLGTSQTQIAREQRAMKERILSRLIAVYESELFGDYSETPDPLAESWKQSSYYKALLRIGQELGLEEPNIQKGLLALLNPPERIARLILKAKTLSLGEKRVALRAPELQEKDWTVAIGYTLSFKDGVYEGYDPEMRLVVGFWKNSDHNPEVRRLAGYHYQQYLQSGATSSPQIASILFYAGYRRLSQEEYLKVVQDERQPLSERLAALHFGWGRVHNSENTRWLLQQVRNMAQKVKTKDDFSLVLKYLVDWGNKDWFGGFIFKKEARALYDSDFAVPYRSPKALRLVKTEEEEVIPKIKAEKVGL